MIALNQQTYKHFKSLIVTHQLDDDAIYSEAKPPNPSGFPEPLFITPCSALSKKGI